VTRIYNGGNKVILAREINGSASVLNSVSVSATSNLYFRLDRDPATETVTGYYSRDGATWTSLGSVVQTLNNTRSAIVTGASPGGLPNADISWAEVTTGAVSNPTISVSPSALSFAATAGGSNPANQTIALSNGGGGTLTWTAAANGTAPAWLAVSPGSGTGNGTLTVSVNSASLAPGTYTKAITITAAGATNTPQTVNITLTVNPSGTAHYDFTYPDRTGLLAAGWDFLAVTSTGSTRNTEQTTGTVVNYNQTTHPGTLRIPVDTGDLWAGLNSTRNSLFRSLPANWTGIRLELLSFAPTQDYQQAGLLAYQDDDNYVQVTRIYNGGNKVILAREINGSASVLNSVSVSATSNLYFRLNRNPATGNVTGYYSLNGTTWTSLGSVVQTLNNPRFAIVTGASPGGLPAADISWAEVQ
jgi:hypothetical protein